MPRSRKKRPGPGISAGRSAALQKVKENRVKVAAAVADPLQMSAICPDEWKNLCRTLPGDTLQLSFKTANALSAEERGAIVDLFTANMKDFYVHSQWGWDIHAKTKELFHTDARYLLVHGLTEETGEEASASTGLAAFVHFRFLVENQYEVLYLYEIQVGQRWRGSGLGSWLMSCTERIGRALGMKFLLLTVFKANVAALSFYKDKLAYEIDESSPSRCGDDTADYEILSKCLDVSVHNDPAYR